MTVKKWFTLVEMLIVIVIIGILAAALVPKLVWVQERARDVARRNELQQVASAVMTFELDNGFFPRTWGSVASLSWQLLGTYLKQMPKDPRAQTNIFWCSGTNTSDGEYYYSPMKKAGINGGSFALISVVEQMSMANYVNKSPFTCPASSTSESRTLSDQLCVRIETTTLSWWATNCQYNPNSPSTNQLLLILVN